MRSSRDMDSRAHGTFAVLLRVATLRRSVSGDLCVVKTGRGALLWSWSCRLPSNSSLPLMGRKPSTTPGINSSSLSSAYSSSKILGLAGGPSPLLLLLRSIAFCTSLGGPGGCGSPLTGLPVSWRSRRGGNRIVHARGRWKGARAMDNGRRVRGLNGSESQW